ncbi:hypothetical protein [Breoghania sp.]
MHMRIVRAGLAGAALLGLVHSAGAQEVTLKLHQMLPPQADIPAKVLVP